MRIKGGKCNQKQEKWKKYIKRGYYLDKLYKWHSNSAMIFYIFLQQDTLNLLKLRKRASLKILTPICKAIK